MHNNLYLYALHLFTRSKLLVMYISHNGNSNQLEQNLKTIKNIN